MFAGTPLAGPARGPARRVLEAYTGMRSMAGNFTQNANLLKRYAFPMLSLCVPYAGFVMIPGKAHNATSRARRKPGAACVRGQTNKQKARTAFAMRAL
jgi:hypothetical protein